MNKRHYQLIALAALVGGPLIANGFSSYLPGAQPQSQPIDLGPPAAQPAGPQGLVPTAMPTPTAKPAAFTPGAPGLDAQPTLSTEGVSVEPVNPGMPDVLVLAPAPAPNPVQQSVVLPRPQPVVSPAAVTAPASSGTPIIPPLAAPSNPFGEGPMHH